MSTWVKSAAPDGMIWYLHGSRVRSQMVWYGMAWYGTWVKSAVPCEAISSYTVDALCRARDLISSLLRLILRRAGEPILVTDH